MMVNEFTVVFYDVCLSSQNGWTALALASFKEHLEVVEALKAAGAIH